MINNENFYNKSYIINKIDIQVRNHNKKSWRLI